MNLSDIARFVSDKISSADIDLESYVTTDSILQNKAGRETAQNLPPVHCNLTKFNVGDVLVANIRPYLKKVWQADVQGGCSSDVLVFRAKEKANTNFLYSLLLQDSFFDYVMKAPTGSKMPRGDKKHIMRFKIHDFDNTSKQNIGNFSVLLERRIHFNKQINARLEAMSKQMYDYWFVQFDFPNIVGKPYKSSGGKMVWNEELKREIPEGWNLGELQDIANIKMGQSPPGESYNDDGEGMIFYQGCTDFGNRFPTVRKYTTQPTRFAKEGDILLSVRAPVGTLNIAKEDCCIGRGLAALNSKDNCIAYLFGVMVNLKQIFDRRNVDGTTFGSITKDDLFTLKVVRPDKDILKQYHNIINPAFEKQNKIALENIQLSSLRDLLLPMLMNGQVKVEEVEEVGGLMAAEPKTKYGK
jgi:type I restriction enzyme S subunit